MTPQDLLYKSVFSQFMALGYSDRDSGVVASEAVRLWRRNTPHKKAIELAMAQGKKTHKKIKLRKNV